jgi:hypothetical protein
MMTVASGGLIGRAETPVWSWECGRLPTSSPRARASSEAGVLSNVAGDDRICVFASVSVAERETLAADEDQASADA